MIFLNDFASKTLKMSVGATVRANENIRKSIEYGIEMVKKFKINTVA